MKKIKKILKKINFIKVIIVLLYIVIAQFLWNCVKYVLINFMEYKQNTIPYYIFGYGFVIVSIIILIGLIVTLKRFKFNKKKEIKGMEDVGLKNQNDEIPECIEILEGTEKNQVILVLDPKNISVEKLRKRQDDLETIYKIKIDYIQPRIPTKYVDIYCTPWNLLEPTLFEVNTNDHFLDDCLSALITGNTGSGKTYFTHQFLGKIVLNKSNNNENVQVFICDIKNEDFRQFQNRPNYYGINAIDGIRKVHDIFNQRMYGGTSSENEETIICLIEEYAVLLNSLDKKEAEEVKTMVADLLFAGRSKKIITIVSLQRADAKYFPNGAKEQFKKIIMMGNMSKIQLDMLLDEEHQQQVTEINPQGYGYLYEDGKRKLTRIKVAEISQEKLDELDELISHKMG